MKKLLLAGIMLSTLTLTACSISVNEHKPKVIDSLKSVLNTKTDVTTSLIPNGDTELNLGDKTVTVSAETMTSIKSLLHANNALQQALIDIVGSQITDENIATIGYYAEKYHIDPATLLEKLTGVINK